MLCHLHPGITDGIGFRGNSTKALKEIFPIVTVFKHRFALDSTDNDMMQGTGASILALRGTMQVSK
jgi:hypothetical protein